MLVSLVPFQLLGSAPHQKLIIGSPLNSPPYVFQGQGRGMELELVAAVVKKMGFEAVWRYLPPKRIRHQVLQHQLDLGIRTLNLPGDLLYYSRPYIQLQNVAITSDARVQLASIKALSQYSVVAFQNAKEFLGPEYEKAVSRCGVYLEMADQAKQIETLFRRRSQVIIMEKRIFNYFRDKFYPKSEVKIFEIFPPTTYSAVFYDKHLRDEFDRMLLARTQHLFEP